MSNTSHLPELPEFSYVLSLVNEAWDYYEKHQASGPTLEELRRFFPRFDDLYEFMVGAIFEGDLDTEYMTERLLLSRRMPEGKLTRLQLIALVDELRAGNYSEARRDKLLQTFETATIFPSAYALIYFYDQYFDHRPTSAEIVDKALAYKPIILGPPESRP